MEDAFKENLHLFMIGLGVLCIIMVGTIFGFYFKVKSNVAKSKRAKQESQD